jgi:hypothetical protein
MMIVCCGSRRLDIAPTSIATPVSPREVSFMIAGSSGRYSAVSARDHENTSRDAQTDFDSMIVNSLRQYLSRTVHDHEAPRLLGQRSL